MKKKSLIILLIISILVTFFSVLVFLFLNNEINLNKKIVDDSETKWQLEVDRRNGIKVLNNSIKKIETEKNLLETHFAQSSNIVPFLDMMESLGKKAGAKTEVTLVDIPKGGQNLIIEMNATGNFEEIYKFLLLLENSPYELEITSADLQTQNAGNISIKNKLPTWQAKFYIKLLSFM